MLEVSGHVAARESLESRLPVVTLLRGPASVGKWTLATYLIQFHGFYGVDIRVVEKLDMAAARDIVSFASRAPFGLSKVSLIQLDGATDQVLTTLLKLLEEPPRYIKFILVASRPVLDTVVSRCSVVNLGLLSVAEVFEVLNGRLQMRADLASRAAELSRGQIEPAMRASEMDRSKATVLSVLKAIYDQDEESLVRAINGRDAEDAPRWSVAEHELLQVWAVEATTGRWRVFKPQESFELHATTVPRHLLWSLSLIDARPVLALRVALATFVDGSV